MLKSKKIIFVLLVFLVILSACSREERIESEMILVPAGTTSEENASITLSRNIYIGKYEVTQAQFEEIMGFNPSIDKNIGINNPVDQVTWFDAIMYCNKLSEKEGYEKYYIISDIEENDVGNIISAEVKEKRGANGYRLPTLTEWEYAARGGADGIASKYSGSDNIDEVAWYQTLFDHKKSTMNYMSEMKSMPVGEKKANELGIHDMTGNVSEWTNTNPRSMKVASDIDKVVIFNSDRIVAKGGGRYSFDDFCLISKSFNYDPTATYRYRGFRMARNEE
ncbi:MAG: formylglycine-generating enzyme family protein [bacterium]